jgi:hypothetical protein
MPRLCKLLALGLALALTAGLAGAQDKKDAKKEKVVEGVVCCAKCELGKETRCATVVQVKEDGKEVVYYLDADSNKKFPHSKYCKGMHDAKVTIAKTEEKDGKKYVSITKIEEKKKN